MKGNRKGHTTMTTTSTDTSAVELTREWVEQQERYARNMAARMRAFCHPAKAAIYDRKAALCRSWLARQDEARDAARMNLLESWAEHPWPINSADMLRLTVVEFGRTLRDVCDAALSKETK